MTPERRRPSIADQIDPGEGALRQAGRDFLLTFYGSLRTLKLYPVENEQVQRSLDDLTNAADNILSMDDELEIRTTGEFIFVNGTRLRLNLDNYASFSHVLGTLRQCGVGVVRADSSVERTEWQVFVSLLLAAATREATPNRLAELEEKMAQGGITHIVVEPPAEGEEAEDEERTKEMAKRTYERSVAVTREVVNSVRMGRSANVKKVKRAVQGIVDQVLNNETSLMGLTTIRDYDEYTFTHSVNVCIFSVAIGRRLGLSKLQLYDLGLAALMHDVGKSRVPVEILNKRGALSDEEWRVLQSHPWLGVLTLFGLRGYGEVPYRSMIVCHEHHMKVDLTGYPKSIRPRELSLFSKIIAVADGFDAATSRRSYQTTPLQPDQVLQEMWQNPRRGYDKILVKALINLLGIYPVGTCVILDSLEVAVVHGANPDPSHLNRPLVRIICSSEGALIESGPVVNLADTTPDGTFQRSIVKVTDPARYGIDPAAYFV